MVCPDAYMKLGVIHLWRPHGGGRGQAHVDGGRGQAPCGRPHRKLKLESTDVKSNQTIGLTCKLSSARMTLMYRKNRLAAECSRKKFSLKQLFEANGWGCATSVRWQVVPNNRSRVSKSSRGLGSGRFRVFQKMLIAGSQYTSRNIIVQ